MRDIFWENIKNKAANKVVSNTDIFTEDIFFEYMPQFTIKKIIKNNSGKEFEDRESLIPQKPLENFIRMANDNILQCKWFDKWEYACSLYVAHHATLYLKSYSDSSKSIKDLISKSTPNGLVASSSLGDASISYDNSMTTNMSKWGPYSLTTYGQILIQEAKLLGIGAAFYI